MKYLPLFLIAGIFSLAAGCAGSDTTTEKGLGKCVFEAVKNQDTEELYSYVLKASDRDYLLKKLTVSTEKHRLNARGYMDYKIAAWARYKDALIPDLRQSGQKQGIDWNTITYDSIVSKTHFSEGTYKSDITVYMHPTQDGTICRLVLDDCLKTERGWVLFDDVTLQF